jgi:hypothetical protein
LGITSETIFDVTLPHAVFRYFSRGARLALAEALNSQPSTLNFS